MSFEKDIAETLGKGFFAPNPQQNFDLEAIAADLHKAGYSYDKLKNGVEVPGELFWRIIERHARAKTYLKLINPFEGTSAIFNHEDGDAIDAWIIENFLDNCEDDEQVREATAEAVGAACRYFSGTAEDGDYALTFDWLGIEAEVSNKVFDSESIEEAIWYKCGH